MEKERGGGEKSGWPGHPENGIQVWHDTGGRMINEQGMKCDTLGRLTRARGHQGVMIVPNAECGSSRSRDQCTCIVGKCDNEPLFQLIIHRQV